MNLSSAELLAGNIVFVAALAIRGHDWIHVHLEPLAPSRPHGGPFGPLVGKKQTR